ncbi:hypothetical protein QNI19_08895 [Cytophagaceae bacterium DM2B3-1]|uniref:Uncharacterized protein n=1 Tax=Xanthocytophaga flava TaxID=3048013 RepID=A0ABT7CHB4_9BACT|nr:hypothetical protein [Xanthocytophaga flavus]MDJ1472350.1 hypothetical protein [Xanthocytophaga flavus]MDJ1493047.1 hypothetical protein [Xanthocytophaga flavus]
MNTPHTPLSTLDSQKALIAILEEIEKLTPSLADAHAPITLRSLIWVACETISGFALAPDQSLTCLVRKRLLTVLENAQILMGEHTVSQEKSVDNLIRISAAVYLWIDMYRRTI